MHACFANGLYACMHDVCTCVCVFVRACIRVSLPCTTHLFEKVFAFAQENGVYVDCGPSAIPESRLLVSGPQEKIFGMDGLTNVDERQKFTQDWEKALKGGAMKSSLQSFWIFIWWEFLHNLDGDYNDPTTDSLFLDLIWKPLLSPRNDDRDLIYEKVPCCPGRVSRSSPPPPFP